MKGWVSDREQLARIEEGVTALALGYTPQPAARVVSDEYVSLAVPLCNPSTGVPLPVEAITTEGTYRIFRVRGGVTSEIVTETASLKSYGRVYCQYNFPNASWELGDDGYAVFSGISFDSGGVIEDVPIQVRYFVIAADHSSEDVYTKVTDPATGLVAISDDVSAVDTVVDAILEDTGTTLPAAIQAVKDVVDDISQGTLVITADLQPVLDSIAIVDSNVDTTLANTAAIKAKTDNLPASPAAVGSPMTLATDAVNSTSLATSAVTEIQSGLAKTSELEPAVSAQLNTAVGGSPTAKSMRDILHKNASATYDRTTDSLEALRDRVDEISSRLNLFLGEEVVTNGNFDVDTSGWSITGSGATLTRTTTAGEYTSQPGGAKMVGGQFCAMTWPVTIRPLDLLEISFWAKNITAGDSNMTLGVYVYDRTAAAVVPTMQWTGSLSCVENGGGWTYYTFRWRCLPPYIAAPPSSNCVFEISNRTDATRTLLVDQVRITRHQNSVFDRLTSELYGTTTGQGAVAADYEGRSIRSLTQKLPGQYCRTTNVKNLSLVVNTPVTVYSQYLTGSGFRFYGGMIDLGMKIEDLGSRNIKVIESVLINGGWRVIQESDINPTNGSQHGRIISIPVFLQPDTGSGATTQVFPRDVMVLGYKVELNQTVGTALTGIYGWFFDSIGVSQT